MLAKPAEIDILRAAQRLLAGRKDKKSREIAAELAAILARGCAPETDRGDLGRLLR